MKEKELVSVILPFFKTEKEKMMRCVSSIINQTYRHIEIVIINDGSGSNYEELLEEIEYLDSRIIVHHFKNNLGLSAARNYGLDVCKGNYILFIDSDDIINHYMIEKLLTCIKIYNVDIAIGELIVINDYNTANLNIDSYNNIEFYEKLSALEKLITNNGFGSTACGRLAAKNIWLKERNPFPIGVLHEDLAVMWKIINNCKKVCWVRGKYYYYYQGTTSSIHLKKTSYRFCKDFMYALCYRNELLRNKYKVLEKAISFSYLYNLPIIYIYAQQLDESSDKQNLIMQIKQMFAENWKLGNSYKNASIKKKIKIAIFKFNPSIYEKAYIYIKKIKGGKY